MPLADTKTSDSITIETNSDKFLCTKPAKVRINSTLYYSKEQLFLIGVGLPALPCPADRSFYRLFKQIHLTRKRSTLIKTHNNIAAEPVLNIRGDLCIDIYFLPSI
jgi:hypothetical protein